jgi:dihydrofolate reductase
MREHIPSCVTLLVAWDEQRLIGKGSGLPWNIPFDLRLFKRRTKNNTVIFGLNTYNGLPKKPLSGRFNIVVTPEFLEVNSAFPPNTSLAPASSVKDAINKSRLYSPNNEIFICGGASIYQQALDQDLVDIMLVSIIPGEYEGNVYFPKFNYMWDRVVVEKYDEFVVEKWTKETK